MGTDYKIEVDMNKTTMNELMSLFNADDIQDIVHAERWAIKRNLEVPKTYFEA